MNNSKINYFIESVCLNVLVMLFDQSIRRRNIQFYFDKRKKENDKDFSPILSSLNCPRIVHHIDFYLYTQIDQTNGLVLGLGTVQTVRLFKGI